MKKILLSSIILVLLFPISCKMVTKKSVTQLASLSIQIVHLLRECQDMSEEYTKKVSDVNRVMEEGINGDRTVLELAKFWEKYWGDVHSDYNDLRNKLIKTHSVSESYFAELEMNNSLISDPVLKEGDKKKTSEIRERYNEEYKAAVESLLEAEKILKEGDDILLVLRNNVLRSVLEHQIIVLHDIQSKSEIFNDRMQEFSKNCMPLFSNS